MSVPRSWLPRKHSDRPPPCPVCGAGSWWNGWREVRCKHLGSSGHVESVPSERRHRARCSSRDCPAPGWTVYPPGCRPHRHFGLDVMASAVATSAFDLDDVGRRVTLAVTARRYRCSGGSVARWTRWIVGLTDIEALARECIRIDPDGMPMAAGSATGDIRSQAGWTLALCDRLAELLERREVLPRGNGPGVVRILDDQRLHRRTHLPPPTGSPPLSTAAGQTAVHGL